MKPNEFKMNTDYLSIAQTNKQEVTCVIPGGTVRGGGQVLQDYDFNIKPTPGSIDQIFISKDGGDYMVGHMFATRINPAYMEVIVNRTSASNLRVELMVSNFISSSSVSYPTMTLKVKIISFKPPNVF